MAVDIQQRIASIQAKAHVLAQRYGAMKGRLTSAEAKIVELTAVIAEQEAELDRLRSELGYLKNAASLTASGGDVAQTREVISGLVREIDKCIRDLSD